MANVLIAGCGYIGGALGVALVEKGHSVWGIKRTPGELPGNITPVIGNLTQATEIPALPADLDYVFYTASADAFNDDSYLATYVHGLQNLLRALARAKQQPTRVFFTSSTSVYAQTDGAWVDESSETEPSHFSGKRLIEAEKILADSDFPGTSLRLGGIYGPGRIRLIHEVLAGKAHLTDIETYTNRIHQTDVVDALIHISNLKQIDDIYNLVDNEPILYNELIEWLAEQLSAPAPEPGHNSTPLSRMRSNKRCSNKRLRDSGFVPTYPTYQEGYGAILEEVDIDEAADS